jgi:hypothetical protein
MDKASYSLWQNGQYQPNWHLYGDGFTIGSSLSDNFTETYFLVFQNQDSEEKQVSYRLQRAWKEYNSGGIATGVALIIAGIAFVFWTYKDKIKQINKDLEKEIKET